MVTIYKVKVSEAVLGLGRVLDEYEHQTLQELMSRLLGKNENSLELSVSLMWNHACGPAGIHACRSCLALPRIRSRYHGCSHHGHFSGSGNSFSVVVVRLAVDTLVYFPSLLIIYFHSLFIEAYMSHSWE